MENKNDGVYIKLTCTHCGSINVASEKDSTDFICYTCGHTSATTIAVEITADEYFSIYK